MSRLFFKKNRVHYNPIQSNDPTAWRTTEEKSAPGLSKINRKNKQNSNRTVNIWCKSNEKKEDTIWNLEFP